MIEEAMSLSMIMSIYQDLAWQEKQTVDIESKMVSSEISRYHIEPNDSPNRSLLNIKGPVCRADIANGNKNHVHQGPNPKSPKAE